MSKRKRLSDWLNDRRVIKAAVIVGIAAILLIGLTNAVDLSGGGQDQVREYASRTEERMLEIVSQISGAGDVKIFLTMDDSGENVYQKNTDQKTVSIEPKVRGVVVVCDGGDDPTVVARILDAVTKALDISSDKVCITK